MGYSIDPISADCYEGTTCLINKFGIKDEKKLSQMETLITTAIRKITAISDTIMIARRFLL